MKRKGYLLHQIADIDNLRLAFWKARKGKDSRTEVENFREALDKNLFQLHIALLSGTCSIGDYNYFRVYEPKERVICAASFPERVMQHAIMNICHTNFEQYQIYNSYASRVGKGQYAALEKAKCFQHDNTWFLKMDVRRFFDSVDHQALICLLTRRFKDPALMELFRKIIDSYHTTTGKGLPIGNLTSQYFANHYLALSDHYVIEKLGIKCYVRYMDDMVMWSNDKTQLLKAGALLKQFLLQHLHLQLKEICFNNTTRGLPFLGYRLYKTELRLTTSVKNRFKSKMIQYDGYFKNGFWDQSTYSNHLLPLIAFVDKAKSKGLKMKVMENFQ